MINKGSKFWNSLLTHTFWPTLILQEFSKILFDAIENLLLTLDVSYRTTLDLEGEDEEHVK
jgi:hypothetical protein